MAWDLGGSSQAASRPPCAEGEFGEGEGLSPITGTHCIFQEALPLCCVFTLRLVLQALQKTEKNQATLREMELHSFIMSVVSCSHLQENLSTNMEEAVLFYIFPVLCLPNKAFFWTLC